MEYHLDRRIVLSQDSEFKNLYSWFLQESDEDGHKLHPDQIPWAWSLYFTATELTLQDSLSVRDEYRRQDSETTFVTKTAQAILAKLQPGHARDRAMYTRPSYSMFGTDRYVTDFQLAIYPTDEADGQAMCRAWGNVSYTTEVDFRDETIADSLGFQLYVPTATFAEYARKVESGAVDEAILRVGAVQGFYSDWSPSISTSSIKILTDDRDHKVEIPAGCEIDPPRLGRVGETELYLRRSNALKGLPSEPEDDWAHDELFVESKSPPPIPTTAPESRTVPLLSSLRLAAWIIAALLFVLVIK